MRRALLLACLTSACAGEATPPPPAPACHEERFEGSGFTVCPATGSIELINGARRFADLQAALGPRARSVAFAMNAGMFDSSGQPIGLSIVAGKQIRAINRREGGGNFHLLPNGVFLVRKDGRTEVVTAAGFKPSPTIAFASQSGPMLVIDGKLHPKFDPDGPSRYVRNGVGIGPDGKAVFVISADAMSFGKFARFFRDRVKTRDALYFDGSVSSLWDPAAGRMDDFTDLGPMVVVFRPSASAPGPASPARP
jgi:uncharacterized protein YigE (DUF2233 family)